MDISRHISNGYLFARNKKLTRCTVTKRSELRIDIGQQTTRFNVCGFCFQVNCNSSVQAQINNKAALQVSDIG